MAKATCSHSPREDNGVFLSPTITRSQPVVLTFPSPMPRVGGHVFRIPPHLTRSTSHFIQGSLACMVNSLVSPLHSAPDFLADQDTAEVPKLTHCYMSGGSSLQIVADAHRYREADRQFSCVW